MHIMAVKILHDSFPNSVSLKLTKTLSTKIIKIKEPLPNDVNKLSKGHMTRVSLPHHRNGVGEDPGKEVMIRGDRSSDANSPAFYVHYKY